MLTSSSKGLESDFRQCNKAEVGAEGDDNDDDDFYDDHDENHDDDDNFIICSDPPFDRRLRCTGRRKLGCKFPSLTSLSTTSR